MTQVYMRHIRAALLCSRGTRGFFRRHGLDWGRFLAEGIPAEKLSATGDAMALRVVAIAEYERGQG